MDKTDDRDDKYSRIHCENDFKSLNKVKATDFW